MSKSNFMTKFLSLLLVIVLEITMVPMNVFAIETDTTGPAITVVSCDKENETLYEGDSITLIFSLEDEAGIGSNKGMLMTYRDTNGDNYREFTGPSCTYNADTGLYECTFTVNSTDKVGRYEFAKLHAYDTLGNYSYIRPDIYFDVAGTETDTIGPVITVVACDKENETLYEGETITLTFSLEDEAGIGSNIGMLMTYTDPNGENYREFSGPPIQYSLETGLYECSYTVSETDKVGTYKFAKLHAYDKKGNYSYIRLGNLFTIAEEKTDLPSCDEGAHDFTIEKYDESNHWYECSLCGVSSELLSHYYDENGDTMCNGCSYERSIVEEVSIDKTLLSESETATITLKVIEGYTAKWIYFYKPITGNTETVYLYFDSDNTYTGSFCVDDQTEAGIWKAKYITLKDAEDGYVYLYNSSNYTGTYYDKADLSSLDFEVTGTDADVVVPVIESYSIDKTIVSAGEKVTVSVQVADEHLPSSFYFWYKNPSSESECVSMKKVDDTGLYQGTFSIDANSESGLWRPYYFTVSDTNGNSVSLYNSKVTSYGSDKKDLSSLNFEVVEITEDENEDAESFIVKFTDGYGNTLSTQRVNKDEDAVEPETPTNELYLFSGWDKDFTNITCNTTVNATWVLNPNVVYDKEAHIGKTFSIEVYSAASQTYTITCSEDVDFTSSLVSSGMIFTDQLYYSKKYEIDVNAPGSYLFYVKGSKSSNTLTYKVKITDHDFDSEYTIDKAATCTEDGSKYRKCTLCDATTDVTVIEKLGHDYADEWTVDKAATCTENGSKSHHCSRCDAIADVTVIDALSSTGHQYSEEWVIDKEATCTEVGSKSHHCTICGDRSKIEEIPVLKHSYGAWVVAKEATCTKTGSRYKECVCGHKVTETISATGHNLGEKIVVREPTCYDFGETQQYCQNCNYIIYEYPDAIKHVENEKPVIKPATYSHGGDIEYFCQICKNSIRYEYIPHLSTSYISKDAYVYDGSIKTPSVTVKNDAGDTLKNNIDYTVSYSSGRIKIGKYKVTIKFKGKYSGTDTHYFYIVPNLSAPKKVSSTLFGYDDVKITWSSVKNADAYKIYYKKSGGSYKLLKTTTSLSYKKSNLSDGIKYYFKIVPCTYRNGYYYADDSYKTTSICTLKKVVGVKVAKSSSKVKVSWINISGETGYQISKSTKKSGTSIVATYKTASGKSKTISATKGKTYYYKVRAYKVVDGKKIYGPWSAPIKYVRK